VQLAKTSERARIFTAFTRAEKRRRPCSPRNRDLLCTLQGSRNCIAGRNYSRISPLAEFYCRPPLLIARARARVSNSRTRGKHLPAKAAERGRGGGRGTDQRMSGIEKGRGASGGGKGRHAFRLGNEFPRGDNARARKPPFRSDDATLCHRRIVFLLRLSAILRDLAFRLTFDERCAF